MDDNLLVLVSLADWNEVVGDRADDRCGSLLTSSVRATPDEPKDFSWLACLAQVELSVLTDIRSLEISVEAQGDFVAVN